MDELRKQIQKIRGEVRDAKKDVDGLMTQMAKILNAHPKVVKKT